MKKTISVNLANRNFYIEEDAYNMLDQYIKGIREYYRTMDPEGEIVEDFETRMGELFSDKIKLGHEVITVQLTREVIEQLGRVEDLEEHDTEGMGFESSENASESSERANFNTQQESPRSTFTEKLEKKLYREPRGRWLGGVLSGLAMHFDVDVSLLRLITVLLLFTPLGSVVIILYIAGWIFLPKAETATDRLRMEGKPINSETLWGKISEDSDPKARAEAEEARKALEPRSKSNVWKKVFWWCITIVALAAVIGTLIWTLSWLSGANFLDDGFGSGEPTGLMVAVALILAIAAIAFVFVLIGGILFVFYVLPIGLILRAERISGVVKFLLILLWLFLTISWVPFIFW